MSVHATRRAAFTMVELVLAMGLLAVLSLALVRLLDTSLTIWSRTEGERDLLDTGGAVLDLVAKDLHALEGGPRGDLLADWRAFDLDADGIGGLPWPRLRLVRQASAAEWRRAAEPGAELDRHGGLVEICWALLPDRRADDGQRGVGVLWRGERRVGAPGTSFFAREFFAAGGAGLPGAMEPLSSGVLWFEPRFATQTSWIDPDSPDPWALGDGLADCASSWDAFDRGRPDEEVSFLNTPGAGMPAAGEVPLLPRRVRVTLEIERPSDLRYRTRLDEDLPPAAQEMSVGDEERLPPPGSFVLVDEEWMRVGARQRGSVSVQRARRGSRAAPHEAGARVHYGLAQQRTIVVPTVREDWDL